MIRIFGATLISVKELVFRIVLNILVFIFYSFDQYHPQIESHQVVFYLNYAFVAFLMNYFLLPKFFYKKKYLAFFAILLLATAVAIILEEFVLEQIYFPETKGEKFGGVLYTLVEGMPVITFLTAFKFGWDALIKQREVDDLKNSIKESELQFLKSQINPHFLFNNLNNLYSYAVENSPRTPDIILELSAVLRYMLYECKEKYVPLAKEIELIENYIRLNDMQIEDRGKVNFTKQNIEGNHYIAPLILVVFIENAYKHSTASQTKGIFIDVEMKLTENRCLEFACRNSYQPQSNTDNLSKGIGLENVKKRLQLLYPGSHKLEIKKNEKLFEVVLSIDIVKK